MNTGWYINENDTDEMPSELDTTSSSIYVYVRKDFVRHEEMDSGVTYYSWQEYKIPKSVYDIFIKVITNEAVTNELLNAICELAELVGGQ